MPAVKNIQSVKNGAYDLVVRFHDAYELVS